VPSDLSYLNTGGVPASVTDPASASPGCLIAGFAKLCVCRRANSVSTKLGETRVERGRMAVILPLPDRIPFQTLRVKTHLAHKSAVGRLCPTFWKCCH
jgi:hypothetical protein